MIAVSRVKPNLVEENNSRLRMERSGIKFSDWNYRFFKERQPQMPSTLPIARIISVKNLCVPIKTKHLLLK